MIFVSRRFGKAAPFPIKIKPKSLHLNVNIFNVNIFKREQL